MAITYGDTLATDLSYVRFQIGDTVDAVAMFSDAEITAALTNNDNNAFRAISDLLTHIPTSPGCLLALHDASGRTFSLARLTSVFAQLAEKWSGRR